MNADPEYSEEYYELLERLLGEEQAAWARLPPAEREKELCWYHENFDTPDDLAEWPPELDGGLYNGFFPSGSHAGDALNDSPPPNGGAHPEPEPPQASSSATNDG